LSRPQRIVVAGAGIVGSSVAFLAARAEPERDVLLVDRVGVAAGASGIAMGAIRNQLDTPLEVTMAAATVRYLRASDNFFDVGYLTLATTDHSATDLAERAARHRRQGLSVRTIKLADLGRWLPFLNLADVRLATFCDEDGVTDPLLATRRMAEWAVDAGVTLIEGSDIVDVTEPEDVIVIACGAESAAVARSLGTDLPIRVLVHQLTSTKPLDLPDDLPVVVERDSGLHFRRRGSSLIVGGDEHPGRFDQAPAVDSAYAERLIGNVAHRLQPSTLVDADQSWAGCYDMTPDRRPLLGRLSDTLYAACGFSGRGFILSVGAARLLVDELLGLTPVDPAYHARRFLAPPVPAA
jgi:glycine/D-amino acid oxidase-like deaminating enzyme